ncbi:aminodeoxychorismate synthase component I [Gillisia sp. Q332]|uniref:aminodeoxychorismate synthase component I n=1 Tax=Gillisia xinjiangensis TaxID=3384765 RepID=UPI00391A6463
MRTTREYILKNPKEFKEELLEWSRQFEEIAWLDSNEYDQSHSDFDAVLAVQAFTVLKTDFDNGFSKLQEYQEVTKDWIFGYLSYDLKNDVEQLSSRNYDNLHFPDLYFFQPAKIIQLKGETVTFNYLKMVDDEMETDFEEIYRYEIGDVRGGKKEERDNREEIIENSQKKEAINSRISREQYLNKVKKMLSHIHRGDIYEANFCQEFFAENRTIEPFEVFKNLNKISIPPFAVFLKLDSNYLLCASPERYLKKSGNKIISQPIKGTAKRAKDPEEDLKIALGLSKDQKERSENVMIVDLVRNDLSKVAKRGSVEVEELCRVYSFKQVHQMISTVSAELEKGIPPVEVLRSTFPMGSMTGAPKISAMKIIEELEETKRGLYSGAVGYFTPEGDFDFNVVIRSILYNSERKYVSFSVGGAITSRSVPEKEYEECLLKSEAMRESLI